VSIKCTVSLSHVPAIATDCDLIVIGSKPQVRFDMVDAVADKLVTIWPDEPPDAIDLFDMDKAGGFG